MKKISLKKWQHKNKIEKVLHILAIILAVLIILNAILVLFNVWKNHVIFEILFGIFMLIQTLEYWKYDKITAIVDLIVGLIILTSGIVTIIL